MFLFIDPFFRVNFYSLQSPLIVLFPVRRNEAILILHIACKQHGMDNDEVNAILVQLPLYKHLDSQSIIELINPKKDVDGFHPINVGRLNCSLKPYAICCTPKGIIKLF